MANLVENGIYEEVLHMHGRLEVLVGKLCVIRVRGNRSARDAGKKAEYLGQVRFRQELPLVRMGLSPISGRFHPWPGLCDAIQDPYASQVSENGSDHSGENHSRGCLCRPQQQSKTYSLGSHVESSSWNSSAVVVYHLKSHE